MDNADATIARTPVPADTSYDGLVRAEQVRLLYEGLLVSTTGSIIGALLIVFMLWEVAPREPMLIWFALMAANQLWRIGLYLAYRRKGALAPEEVGRWAVYWSIGSGLSGCIWGAASFVLFLPDVPVAQAVLIVLIFTVTSAAVLLTGSYLPAFYVFVLPAMVSVIVRTAIEGEAMHYALAVIAFFSTVAILSFGRKYNRTLVQSLRNRFHNETLAQRLAQQNTVLESAHRVVEDASRAKTQFFAAASHDLRQPLHAIGLFTSALAEKAATSEVKQLVASINQSVRALQSLFNELLDISKIDSGVIKPAIRDFPASELVEWLSAEFSAEAAAKGIVFTVEAPPTMVRSDPVLLERILRNLIANALRYTEAGEVSLGATQLASTLRLEVRDTGIGIAQADQQKIFEEFTQLQNPARTSKKGLGLGLSIVKRLCDLLGYRISLNSKPGQGSTFSFEVPLGVAIPRPAADAQPAKTARSDLSDLGGRLIVVIDDEEAIVAGMQALLSVWGAEVIASTSGDDVISRVHEAGRLPDLFIVDYRLGDADTGIDVAQRLRQTLDPEIPAVLVTGSITPDLEEKARVAGLEFLLKPVTAADLARCIEGLLRIRLV
ncbi:MAG: hybrid sensor histidine kinase/response regulator [Burkholderiales bacterium]